MPVPVAIARLPSGSSRTDIRTAVERAVDLVGGIGAFIAPGLSVLVKPNVGVPAPPESARNTDPRVVEAVIGLLRGAGAGEIFIGESAVVGCDTGDAFQVAGIEDVARRTGAVLVDFKQQPTVRVRVKNGLVLKSLQIARLAASVDAVVNIAKLKTISAVPVSLGMKNFKGLLPDREKKRFHHTDLNRAIVDLNSVVRAKLTIVDGIIANEMYEPREANLIVAGGDVVAVDTVCCKLVGVDPATVGYLSMAAANGMGVGDTGEIEVRGEQIPDAAIALQTAPDTAKAFAALFPEVSIADGNACSGCTGSLYMALKTCRDRGILSPLQGLTLAIGRDARPTAAREATLCIGNCLKPFRHGNFSLEGCPFPYMELVELLQEVANRSRRGFGIRPHVRKGSTRSQ